MKDGKPTGISATAPFDASAAALCEGMAALLVRLAIVLCCVVFFLVTPIVLLIKFLRKKDKELSPFAFISNALLVSGTLLVINFVVFTLGLLENFSQTGPFVQSSIVASHVLINYALLALIIALFLASIYLYRKDKPEKKARIRYSTSAVLLASFILILWSWNYFTLM
jgi:formate hydrogenlyase subunit 3/multisubunit Na+/H+ antiporter MnhD subunit